MKRGGKPADRRFAKRYDKPTDENRNRRKHRADGGDTFRRKQRRVEISSDAEGIVDHEGKLVLVRARHDGFEEPDLAKMREVVPEEKFVVVLHRE